MYRTSTFTTYANSIATLQRRQVEMGDAQTRLTTGLRVVHASDDPTAAGRAERARALMQRADSTKRSVDASQTDASVISAPKSTSNQWSALGPGSRTDRRGRCGS